MICTEMFETINGQFVFIKAFFVGDEVTCVWETWYGKLHAQRLVVFSVTQHHLEKKFTRCTFYMWKFLMGCGEFKVELWPRNENDVCYQTTEKIL